MPVATHEVYCKMLDSALANKYAYPAVNVVSIESANAALAAFAEARSDGIIQISIGGGKHASGSKIGSTAIGAIGLANYIHYVADYYDIYVALHTDHCQLNKLDEFVRPLIAETPGGARFISPTSSKATCLTAGPCPWRRTSRWLKNLRLCAPRTTSCWRSRPALSAVKRMA